MTSASDMQHQPRPGRINCGHIGQETSVVACMHQPRDVGKWQAASTKVFTHLTWHVRIGQATSANDSQHQPRPARINHGVCASVVAYAHRPRDIGQWQEGSTKACTHLMWHIRIGKATSANDRQHQPRLSRISRGVYTSAGRHRHWPIESSISQGQHASDVACALRASDVGNNR
ncbi:hypothetical protein H5410_014682 [Solanum commersonii]|uniref:Uncharacterized protein n=1 Tax=Solanum commersonii TaxID=4109 RepID=A0A9J5ZS39_SOLCO|nr:hypothetical protein H5410_014682 [Solanum commersonii]